MTREEIKKAMRDTKKEVVLKNLHKLLSLVEGYPEYEDCVGYAIEALEQEPKTGHWIKIKPYPLQMHEYECSECRHETDDNTESYCSDCGAKMVEPQESEEQGMTREEAITVFKAFMENPLFSDVHKTAFNVAIKALEQEPRKGNWIEQNDDYHDWYECSECGYGSEGEMQYSSDYDVRTNFCPNCGADMREVRE